MRRHSCSSALECPSTIQRIPGWAKRACAPRNLPPSPPSISTFTRQGGSVGTRQESRVVHPSSTVEPTFFEIIFSRLSPVKSFSARFSLRSTKHSAEGSNDKTFRADVAARKYSVYIPSFAPTSTAVLIPEDKRRIHP